MLLLGCKPNGRFTEQHDVFFDIGSDIGSLKQHILQFWPEANGKLHIDAWREVTLVDSYQVEVVPRTLHADDKYGVDVDDIYNIEDVLPGEVKEKYSIRLQPGGSERQDPVQLGYLMLNKI